MDLGGTNLLCVKMQKFCPEQRKFASWFFWSHRCHCSERTLPVLHLSLLWNSQRWVALLALCLPQPLIICNIYSLVSELLVSDIFDLVACDILAATNHQFPKCFRQMTMMVWTRRLFFLFVCFCVLLLFVYSFETGPLYIPYCPGTHYVDQAFNYLPASAGVNISHLAFFFFF